MTLPNDAMLRGDTTAKQDDLIFQLVRLLPGAEISHSIDPADSGQDNDVWLVIIHPIYETLLRAKVIHDSDAGEARITPMLDDIRAWYDRQDGERDTTTVLPWRVQIRSSTVAAFETTPTRAQIHSLLTEGVTLDDIVIRHERVAI